MEISILQLLEGNVKVLKAFFFSVPRHDDVIDETLDPCMGPQACIQVFITHWKIEGAVDMLNGRQLYLKRPSLVLITVHSCDFSYRGIVDMHWTCPI